VDELVVVEVVASEPEAELQCSLLRSAGIRCMSRVTNRGAGAADGLAVGGPHEILVRADDVEVAREVLQEV
jgi:Putative prokaryotic signal transducing protein